MRQYSIRNLETLQADIAKADLPDKSFDLIVANFSLHHEIRSGGYSFSNEATRQEALQIFRKLRSCLRNNGKLVLREMSRVNFWRFMPYKWKMSHIDWEIHPTLPEWLWLLENSGFRNAGHAYLTPYFLRGWPSPLVRNKIANFFFSSTFYLYAET